MLERYFLFGFSFSSTDESTRIDMGEFDFLVILQVL